MATAPVPGPAGGPGVPDRTCGRCRGTFAGDPDAHPTAQGGWWVCATCREALMGPVVTRDRP